MARIVRVRAAVQAQKAAALRYEAEHGGRLVADTHIEIGGGLGRRKLPVITTSKPMHFSAKYAAKRTPRAFAQGSDTAF